MDYLSSTMYKWLGIQISVSDKTKYGRPPLTALFVKGQKNPHCWLVEAFIEPSCLSQVLSNACMRSYKPGDKCRDVEFLKFYKLSISSFVTKLTMFVLWHNSKTSL